MKDVHRLSSLGVRLEDSSNGGFLVHNNSVSSLVVEVKSNQNLDKSLVEFKESVLSEINETFSLGDWYLKVPRKTMCSQCRYVEGSDH